MNEPANDYKKGARFAIGCAVGTVLLGVLGFVLLNVFLFFWVLIERKALP